MSRCIRQIWDDLRQGQRVVWCDGTQVLGWGEGFLSLVSAARDQLDRYSAREKSLRVVVGLGPDALARLANESSRAHRPLLPQGLQALTARRWDPAAVAEHLRYINVLDTPEVLAAVMETTGGWPALIYTLYDQMVSISAGTIEGADPRPHTEWLRGELVPGTTLSKALVRDTGLDALRHHRPTAIQVLRAVSDLGSVGPGELTADLVEGDLPTTDEDVAVDLELLQILGLLAPRDGSDDLIAETLAAELTLRIAEW